jgi:hypothetical protein
LKRRLWKRATLSTGVSFGEAAEGWFTGTFERQMKEGSVNGSSLINFIN